MPLSKNYENSKKTPIQTDHTHAKWRLRQQELGVRGLKDKTEEISNLSEAEDKAKEFMETKHPKTTRVFFKRTFRYGDSWVMQGEFWFRRAYFFTARRLFKLQIEAETGEVKSYEETFHSR